MIVEEQPIGPQPEHQHHSPSELLYIHMYTELIQIILFK